MKNIYLPTLLISLLLSPTLSQINDERFFFKRDKHTTNPKKGSGSSRNATVQIIGSAIIIGVGIIIERMIAMNSYKNSYDGFDNSYYSHNNSAPSSPKVIPYKREVEVDDSSENALYDSCHSDNNSLQPNPEFIEHNRKIEEEIEKTNFYDALKSMINTPLLLEDNEEGDVDYQGWELNRCMLSLEAIKKMNTYKFELDDKFTNIDIIQGLSTLINSRKLQYDYNYTLALDTIESVLINGSLHTGFQEYKDRTEIHNKIKHMVYALNRYPNDETASIDAHLASFVSSGVVEECKYAWEQVLNQLIDPLSKNCDCRSCTKYRSIEPFSMSDIANNVYNALAKISMDIKDSSFKLALTTNENKEDKEQVHAVNYYAKQLPELGIAYDTDDAYIHIGDLDKDINEVTKDFLKIYKIELVEILKQKFSYTSKNKDTNLQDKVTMWLRASLEKQVKKDNRYKNMQSKELSQWAADNYTSLVWDNEYQVRASFVYFLLHTFGFIRWEAGCYATHPKSKLGLKKASLTISTLNSLRNSIFPEKFDLQQECKEWMTSINYFI